MKKAQYRVINVPASFTKACEFIKAQGFTHIKVELEAKLGRLRDNEQYCFICHGQPQISCRKCSATGYTMVKHRREMTPVECAGCHGERYTTCVTCDGRGYAVGGSYNESWCQQWLLDNLPKETASSLTYARFYYDPSVDSEFTFTLPVRKAYMVIDVINTFNGLANVIGHGLSIDNAGMHISVLPEGKYPCAAGLLDQRKLRNFEKQVTPLLPALYFLATHTNLTRKLSFRLPRISDDQKSSAIYTHGGTMLEYRLFDPCFDKPEAFYDKLEVVAQTLKYYSFKASGAEYKTFRMGPNQSLIKLAALYGDSDNYEALQKTIEHVKPDKTLTSLKKERHFNISKAAIMREQSKKIDRFKSEYEGYLAHEKANLKYRMEQVARTLRDWSSANYLPHHNIIQAVVRFGHKPGDILKDKDLFREFFMNNGQAWGYPMQHEILTEEQYVEAKLLNMAHRLEPVYEISPEKPMDSDREDVRMVF